MTRKLILLLALLSLFGGAGMSNEVSAHTSAPLQTSAVYAVRTVVSSDTAPAGSFGVERVLCPSGFVAIGGGIDMQNVLTMRVTSSAPVFPGGERLLTQSDGFQPAPIGWQASALNLAGVPQEFKVAVVCAYLPDVSTVVSSDNAPAGSFGVERVLCPAGETALGGGVDPNNVLTMQVSSSAPTFPGDERLIVQTNGTNAAPVGWQATAINQAGSSQIFKVAVICAPLTNVRTIVSSDTAPDGTFGVERATCQEGEAAISGGVDMDNVLTMQVTSSGPVFPPGDRLITQINGENPAPNGWQSSAYNDAASNQDFKIAAVCAPSGYPLFLPFTER